jgi:hypothetical protein
MRGAVVGAAVLLTLLITVGPAAGSTRVVAPGAAFSIHLDGFAPRASVTLWLVGRPRTTVVHANRRGVLHTQYRAPTVPGRYHVAVTGAPAMNAASEPPTGPPGAMAVRVVVPRHTIIPIDVIRRGGHRAGGTHAGVPAGTGVDVRALLVLGGSLLGAGLVFVGAARRRATSRERAG